MKVEPACVGVADRRWTAASGDSQRTHRLTAVAPRDCCASPPRWRNRDRYRCGARTNNKTRLAPISPRSRTGPNNLSQVGGRHGERAEHQPIAPAAFRKLRVENDVRARNEGAVCPVQSCGWRWPYHAQGSSNDCGHDDAATHLLRRYAAGVHEVPSGDIPEHWPGQPSWDGD